MGENKRSEVGKTTTFGRPEAHKFKMARTKAGSPRRIVGAGNSVGKTKFGPPSRFCYTRPMRRPRKKKPGQLALQEIKKFQQGTKTIIPKATFQRLVREISRDLKSDLRWESTAMLALQEAAEEHLTETFSECQVAAVHGKRKTVEPKDLYLTRFLSNERHARDAAVSQSETWFREANSDYRTEYNKKKLPILESTLSKPEKRWETWEKVSRMGFGGHTGTVYDMKRGPAASL